jgi:prepilin-type N-terminal cleavage/methylation domain-containing protein
MTDWRLCSEARSLVDRSPAARAGYSLIEFVVAMGILAIVVTQVTLVLTTQHRNYVQQEGVSDSQQDVRLLTEAVLADLRMGGFMVPREAAVGSIDGGNGASDVLCVSDPSVFAPASYSTATDRFDGASVSTVLLGSNSSVTVPASDLDIDGDSVDDFTVGGGILISDGSRVHCAIIDTLAGGALGFSPATPAGATFTPLDTVAVPAVVYQVTGTTLSRNGMALSTIAEDLQVEFGVDADGDGEVEAGEFPVHDLTGANLARTRVARVHLTSLVGAEDDDFTGARPAAANRNAGAADGFRRRRITADARLRNVL